MLDKILSIHTDKRRSDQDLKIGGLITFAAAMGLLALGWFMSSVAEEIWPIMQGIAGLAVCVSIGLYLSGKVTERWNRED